MKHANQTILVAQSEKFGTNAFSIGYPLDQVSTIVSDTNLSPGIQNGYPGNGALN